MDFGWPKDVFVLPGEFLNDKIIQQRLDVLEVGHVPRGTENGMVTNGVETLNISKSCERAIRCWGLVVSDDKGDVQIAHQGCLQPS